MTDHDTSSLLSTAARLRADGRTHEAMTVEAALRSGQVHRVRGLAREYAGALAGVAAQQHQVPGRRGVRPDLSAAADHLVAAQAFQAERPA